MRDQAQSRGGFTPGPWHIEGRRGPGYIISHGVNEYADGPAGYVGVLDPMFHIAGEPSALHANVQAITALPEIVDALKAYRAAQRRMLDKWADGDEAVKRGLWQRLHECEAAADSALSKALGQEGASK